MPKLTLESNEEHEWNTNPHIHSYYANWSLYKIIRDKASKWIYVNPVSYIETVLQQWNDVPTCIFISGVSIKSARIPILI